MTAKLGQRTEQGQALAEFALTIPILLMLIFGVIDFARAVFALSQVVDASRQGVRYGIVDGLSSNQHQYLDCNGIRATALAVPGFVDMANFTIDISYEDAQNTFISDCVDGLSVWDVNHGDVLVVHVEGSIRPLTPVLLMFTDSFTFEYTSRRTILTQGSAYVQGDTWPTPPQSPTGFTATADCNLETNNVSFTWDADEVPTRIEIHDSYSTEIVALPNPENAFCNNCATIPRDAGSGMYYMVTYTGVEPNMMASPSSSDAIATCPELGSITGLVWNDVDGDRRRDHGEPGIANVTLTLIEAGADHSFGTADDTTFAPQTTDANGVFSFVDLAQGLYRVDVQESSPALSGMTLTTRNDPLDLTVNVNEDYTGAIFGFRS